MLVLDRSLRPTAPGNRYDPAEMLGYLKTLLAARLTVVSWEDLIRQGRARVSNVALLGTAIGKGLLPFRVEDITGVLKTRIPLKYLDMNIQALTKAALIEAAGQ
jgi:indolepyruvate ferredoxin oxidoreductase beta subunit